MLNLEALAPTLVALPQRCYTILCMGVAVGIWIYFTSLYRLAQCVVSPIGYVNRELEIRLESFASFLWTGLLVWWTQRVVGVQLVFYDDRPLLPGSDGQDEKEKHSNAPMAPPILPDSLFTICNHVAYMDWFTAFCVAYYHGLRNGLLCWMVNAEALRYFLLGGMMRSRGCIGLQRRFDSDRGLLQVALTDISRRSRSKWLGIYPEGTFIDGSPNDRTVLEASQQHCAEIGIPPFSYVLAPRWKGFAAVMAHRHFKHVLDMTIAFRTVAGGGSALPLANGERRVPEATSLLGGGPTCPDEIHIHFALHAAEEIATAPGGPKQWLFESWRRKDARLRFFRTHDRFPSVHAARRPTEPMFWQPLLCAFLLLFPLLCLARFFS